MDKKLKNNLVLNQEKKSKEKMSERSQVDINRQINTIKSINDSPKESLQPG